MNRIGRILSLTLMIILLAGSFNIASALELVSSYPEEGYDGLQPINVVVKFVFSENVTSDEAREANRNKFKIIDEEGKTIPFDPLYNSEKYPNQVWLQIKETLTDNTQYTVTISEDLVSSGGDTLENPITLNFATRDTAADSKGYMVLMILMVIGMIGFSAWDAKRKLKKQGKESDDNKVNPYKEAKRTGKSVEEVVAKTEKQKAAAQRRKAKAGKKQSVDERMEESRDGVKKVKKRRPISGAGIETPKSIIERREAREAREREEKAKAASRAKGGQQQKSKGSKQRQRKKK